MPRFPVQTALIAFAVCGLTAAPAAADEVTLTTFLDGVIADTGGDGTFDSVNTTSPDFGLTVRRFSGILEDRSVIAFDTTAVPAGATINSVAFRFDTRTVANTEGRVRIVGYAGDGAITLADATRAGATLGQYDAVALSLGVHTVALDVAALQLGSPLEIRLEAVAETVNTQIASSEFASFAVPPQLIVNFTPVPEPGCVLAAAAVAGVGLLRRRAGAVN